MINDILVIIGTADRWEVSVVPRAIFYNDNGMCGTCTDLVVGSPFDGSDGRGAVYVFNGSPEGLRPTASQVIEASTIDDRLVTFGYSMSGGTDLDNNGYAGFVDVRQC